MNYSNGDKNEKETRYIRIVLMRGLRVQSSRLAVQLELIRSSPQRLLLVFFPRSPSLLALGCFLPSSVSFGLWLSLSRAREATHTHIHTERSGDGAGQPGVRCGLFRAWNRLKAATVQHAAAERERESNERVHIYVRARATTARDRSRLP